MNIKSHSTTPPWKILLCLPVHFYGVNTEQIKNNFHNNIVGLCGTFLPATLSLNGIYNPTLSFLNQSNPSISLIEELHKGDIPKEAVQILRALKSDNYKEKSTGIISKSEIVEFGLYFIYFFINH